MSGITTKFTQLLGLRTPIVSGVMAGASGGALAAEVTRAGGFGFIAFGYGSIEKFRSEVALARSILKVQPQLPLPIGIGYLGWQLELPNAPAEECLSAALDENVQAIWLSFGKRLHQWIKYIRDHERSAGATKVFVQVTSVEEALVAVNDWKVDVVIAQGTEAGGHGSSSGSTLLTLIPEILAVLPKDGPPVLAAGGIANGAQIASLLTLGASGVVLGTRFLLSPESLYSNTQRQAIITARTASSVRTMAFDHARNTLGWPEGIDGRALRNSTVEDFEKGVDIDIMRRKFVEGVKNDDPDRILVWAGAGVGLMNRIQPAKEIVEELDQECSRSLRDAALLLGTVSIHTNHKIYHPRSKI
ncbi:Nitronate monooxygenase [Hypsizygus marmoreus]|uniref:Nitronate monooxygenase n=1 Tax=Hypsizygus marmoreus TaxID=39966 RepID=A0A369JJX5_HYPMA|nr:Nitronate monooxygenase [Hypsizygus marmoreus]